MGFEVTKIGQYWAIKELGLNVLSDDDLIDLRDALSLPVAEIIQNKITFGDEWDIDDIQLEKDFKAMEKPRKKKAERLNEGSK